MGKSANTGGHDAALNYWTVTNANVMTVCSQEPTNRTEAITTYELATKNTPTFTGPAAGDGNPGSRKVTVDQAADNTINNSGNAEHIALCSATELLFVTTCTLQALTQGGTVTIPAWDIEISEPT